MTSSDKLVAAAVHRQNEPWLLGIQFQLLPKVHDVGIHGARAGVMLVSPYRVQQTIAAECLRGMADKISQQREFLRRELHRLTGAAHFVAAQVDLNIAEAI